MTGLIPYTIDTKAAAFDVIRDRFSEAACPMADKYLSNPLGCPSGAGDIAYENDIPVGFQAAILRRLYRRSRPILGIVGGMLAMKEKASPVLLMTLMKASIAPRDGSIFFFANTANETSMKMNRMLGVREMGPGTCERIRFAPVFWLRGVKWMLPEPHARRLMSFTPEVFDAFWEHYLASNKGLVSSRSATELAWVFGDRLSSGEVVLLGEFQGETLLGYIVLKFSRRGRRCAIADWIAINDDPKVLDSLLVSAIRFLRRESSAFVLESIGFPQKVELILRRRLPFVRHCPNNSFLWKSHEKGLDIPSDSWFYGPYDGDRCM